RPFPEFLAERFGEQTAQDMIRPRGPPKAARTRAPVGLRIDADTQPAWKADREGLANPYGPSFVQTGRGLSLAIAGSTSLCCIHTFCCINNQIRRLWRIIRLILGKGNVGVRSPGARPCRKFPT